jgi:8-oxo-dGTP pyrophosphatase MutT (NUDIX family)
VPVAAFEVVTDTALNTSMKQKKAKALVKKGKTVKQVGALPYRRLPSGEVEFLLITSRATQRFVIPKGWRMKGKPDWKAAAIEAEQEAGVLGETDRNPIGQYQYWKRFRSAFVPVTVLLYAMEVPGPAPSWPERKQRKREWLTANQAQALVDEPELMTIIQHFALPRQPAHA